MKDFFIQSCRDNLQIISKPLALMPRMDTNRDDVHIVSTGLPHYGLHYAYSIAGPAIKDRCIFNSYTSISQACGLGIKSAILTGQNHGSFGAKVWHLLVVTHRVRRGMFGDSEIELTQQGF